MSNKKQEQVEPLGDETADKSTNGGDRGPDQGPSSGPLVSTDTPVPDSWLIQEQVKEDDKAAPDAPGSASGDGGGDSVDILMRDYLKLAN